MEAPERLLVATHNEGKREEIEALLAPLGIAVESARARGLAVPEETGTTFAANACLKARSAAAATGEVTLADDSGLAVEALGGAPGVYTADWAETPAGRDFDLAMSRVHDELLRAGADEPWRAAFICTLALVWSADESAIFEGRIEGRIVWPKRGTQGHGYDPIFQPDGHEQTFAEMDRWEKNRISHRGRAFAKVLRFLGG